MRTLKEYIVKENNFFKNLGVGQIKLIKEWLDEHKITNYTINSDLTIDVNGTVDLSKYKEKQLPDYIQFRKVSKSFTCSYCPNLETLKGCPQMVGKGFFCNDCPELKSLEGGPQKVVEYFNCGNCPKLKSLKGCPQEVWGIFYCNGCGKQFTKDDVRNVSKVKYAIYI